MRHRGIGDESRLRAVYAKGWEWESQRAIESQRETGRDPVRARESKKEASLTFLAYLNIVLLQNNQIRLSFVVTHKNTVSFVKYC